METDPDHILLFKTDIQTSDDKACLEQVLAPLPIEKWSVDTDDVDCVLRIVSASLQPDEVIQLVNRQGYCCAELT